MLLIGWSITLAPTPVATSLPSTLTLTCAEGASKLPCIQSSADSTFSPSTTAPHPPPSASSQAPLSSPAQDAAAR
jgi:hypothetical protein